LASVSPLVAGVVPALVHRSELSGGRHHARGAPAQPDVTGRLQAHQPIEVLLGREYRGPDSRHSDVEGQDRRIIVLHQLSHRIDQGRLGGDHAPRHMSLVVNHGEGDAHAPARLPPGERPARSHVFGHHLPCHSTRACPGGDGGPRSTVSRSGVARNLTSGSFGCVTCRPQSVGRQTGSPRSRPATTCMNASKTSGQSCRILGHLNRREDEGSSRGHRLGYSRNSGADRPTVSGR
jgi:hypothetical protein